MVLSCLRGKQAPSPQSHGDEPGKAASVSGCPFCKIAEEAPSSADSCAGPSKPVHSTLTSTPSPTRLVLTSDRFVAFHDRTPRAAVHLLAIPREHVGNVKSLSGKPGAELVDSLHAFGRQALEMASSSTSRPSSQRLYGFHIPPFNSVDHLHLHCLEYPLTVTGRIKYCATQSKGRKLKGWTWFVEAEQARGILARGRGVKVGSVYADQAEGA